MISSLQKIITEFIIHSENFEGYLSHHLDKNKTVTKDHFANDFQVNYMKSSISLT